MTTKKKKSESRERVVQSTGWYSREANVSTPADTSEIHPGSADVAREHLKSRKGYKK
ncbi:MAG TPA: hypothetical protein VM901_05830 [Bdellovibrionota bacterium]|jgi:hypothetical protein|nr:hypothetical protein [Bdellovibrionota bacterium]